jgi:hypothetical protein
MTRAAMLALAERAEKATGPDRELDAAIAVAVCWRWEGWSEGDLAVEEAAARSGMAYVADRVRNSTNSIWRLLPAYTASLDAAMTLVPEGEDYAIERVGGGHWCSVDANGERQPCVGAATPALTLCAAALRSLAEQEPE